jgi:hypothetical protein
MTKVNENIEKIPTTRLSGTLPASYGNWTGDSWIEYVDSGVDFSSNYFTGTIPSSYGFGLVMRPFTWFLIAACWR